MRATPECWLTHRVSYGETDAMGVVYYAEYLHFFERARSELIRNFGMSYGDVEKRGILMPVREASCRYRAPARYDDLIHIYVAISHWSRASVTFIYEIYSEDKKKVLTTGSTQNAIVTLEGKPCAIPHWLRELFLSP